MKYTIALILIALLFKPYYQSQATSDTVTIELATLYWVKNHCERKFLKCFGDRRLAKSLVREIKSIPIYEVEQTCREFCTSPSEIRWTRVCNDIECDDRCEVTGGLDDAYFLEIIELRRFDELKIICY